jgi:hypothetical protein
MSYKQTSTSCVVRRTSRRGLSPAIRAQCQALRQEAGRLWTPLDASGRIWTDLVTLHAQARAQGQWLSASDLEPATSSRRPKAGRTRSIASAYKPSARSAPPTSRRPPHCGGKSSLKLDASRRRTPPTPQSTRRWSGRTRRSLSCRRASCACPQEGSGPHCYCRRRRSISELTCAGRR